MAVEYVPAVHSAQLVLPAAMAYRPASQLAHASTETAPATAENLPGSQLVQLVLPAPVW